MPLLQFCAVAQHSDDHLHIGSQFFFLLEQDIDRSDECVFDLFLRDMGSTAWLSAFVFAVALVDDPAVFVCGVPDLGAVPAPAFTALDFRREYTHTAVAVLVLCPSRHLRLDIIEGHRVDDSLVITLHIILRHLALVFLRFLLEEVHGKLLLKEGVALVFFIGKDAADGGSAPDGLAARSRKLPSRKFFCDGVAGQPIQKQLVD